MADDFFRDGFARWTRLATLPWQLFGTTPTAALTETLRRRDALIDALFYDVHVIRRQEAAGLGPGGAGEGALLIVPPSDGADLGVHADAEAFFAAGGGDLDTIAVAGGGSSGLGTAAFARNVADALGRPVAAVVSGHGLADLVTGTVEGTSWLAGLDDIHRLWERLDQSLDWFRVADARGFAAMPPASGRRDGAALLSLLTDDRMRVDRIVAHSKGTLVVSDALHALQCSDRARSDALGERVRIVSISARTKMPRACVHVTEAIGRWDMIGDFAMRREAPATVVVADAWHHTNTELYGHLPVTRVLREIFAAEAEAPAVSPARPAAGRAPGARAAPRGGTGRGSPVGPP